MQDLIDQFQASAQRSGDLIVVTLIAEPSAIRYSIGKVAEGFLGTHIVDLISKIAVANASALTIIDLSGCRVVSSLELSLIGTILFQTRQCQGRCRIDGASPVNEKAIRMVGFDRLLTWQDAMKQVRP